METIVNATDTPVTELATAQPAPVAQALRLGQFRRRGPGFHLGLVVALR
jgi:hypothetical protein